MRLDKIKLLPGLLAIALLAGCNASQQETATQTDEATTADLVITNARLFDATGADVVDGATIVVNGNRISEITSGDVAGKTVIDAAGRTVMPGLVEGHAHNFFDFDFSNPEGFGMHYPKSEEELWAYVEGPMQEKFDGQLQAGFTSSLSVGAFWPYVVEVKERLQRGDMRGPRLFVSGGIFTAPDGHPSVGICSGSEFCANNVGYQVDDVESAREGVRKYVESGVDQLKITYVEPEGPKLKPEVVEAIIDEAHKHGIRAMAHVMDAADVPDMVKWGLDGFVHPPGITLDTDGSLLRGASEKGLPLTVTLGMPPDVSEMEGPEAEQALAFAADYENTRQNISNMIKMGAVPIFGSDMPGFPTDQIINTVTYALTSVGLNNAEVLQATTRNAAQSLMGQDDLGTIEPGNLADIIIVDGDPVADLVDLLKVDIVIQDGKVVVDKTVQ